MYHRRTLLQEVLLFIPQKDNYSVNSGRKLSVIKLFGVRVRLAAVGVRCCIGSQVCAVEVV